MADCQIRAQTREWEQTWPYVIRDRQEPRVHSKKKSTSEHLFWCSRLSQIEDSFQYLEGPNSTWKDHDRNISFQMDPNIPIMVLQGTTVWSLQVLTIVPYL